MPTGDTVATITVAKHEKIAEARAKEAFDAGKTIGYEEGYEAGKEAATPRLPLFEHAKQYIRTNAEALDIAAAERKLDEFEAEHDEQFVRSDRNLLIDLVRRAHSTRDVPRTELRTNTARAREHKHTGDIVLS